MSKYNAIVITRSLRGGHYRGGQYHGPETTKFPPKTFTEQQMEHLAADTDIVLLDLVPKEEAGAPMTLTVTVTEHPAVGGEGSSALADAKPESESDAEAPQISEGGDGPEETKPEDAHAPAKPKTDKKKD